MSHLEFTGKIRIRGINPYVLVSISQAGRLKPGWRKPLPVVVRIEGKPKDGWHINLMPAGNGSFYLYLHEKIRVASATQVGDRVRVTLEFDASYRKGPLHPMPKWFRSGLNRDTNALRNWKALSPSRKKEVLRYFALLKSPEARVRNLARALFVLSGNKGRFLARDWKKGS